MDTQDKIIEVLESYCESMTIYADMFEDIAKDIEKKLCIMPNELTAENGAKALLMGEFHEEVEVPDPAYCNCGNEDCMICDGYGSDETKVIKVPVSWTTIKEIYKRVRNHFMEVE